MVAIYHLVFSCSDGIISKTIDSLFSKGETNHEKDIKKFYKRTGLKVQVHVMKDCDVAIYDRKGKYPRDDAYIWNENFTKNVGKHPEWLEPQEEADIFIIYKINPIEINVDITEADF